MVESVLEGSVGGGRGMRRDMRRDNSRGEVEADFGPNYDWEMCGRCLGKDSRSCSMDSWVVVMNSM